MKCPISRIRVLPVAVSCFRGLAECDTAGGCRRKARTHAAAQLRGTGTAGERSASRLVSCETVFRSGTERYTNVMPDDMRPVSEPSRPPGEMAARVAAFDWARPPVGSRETLLPSLK